MIDYFAFEVDVENRFGATLEADIALSRFAEPFTPIDLEGLISGEPQSFDVFWADSEIDLPLVY